MAVLVMTFIIIWAVGMTFWCYILWDKHNLLTFRVTELEDSWHKFVLDKIDDTVEKARKWEEHNDG